MERVVRKGYLVQDARDRFSFCRNPTHAPRSGTEHLIFYEGNGEDFKLIPGEDDNSSEDNNSSIKIQELLNSSIGMIGIYIALFSNYDIMTALHNVWITVDVDDEAIKKLCGQLMHPKISVHGNTNFGFPFSMSTCNLVPSSQIAVFDGAEDVRRIMSDEPGHVIPVYVNFSVLLEWIEFKPVPAPRKRLVLSKLLSGKLFADCSIITGDGKVVRCHKIILAASSDVLYAMLSSDMQESQRNRIEMKELTEDVVNQLLAYLYEVDDFNSKELKEHMAFELLKTAHQYNILGMEHMMLETLLGRAAEKFDINLVLELYLFTAKVDGFNTLCNKMADILRRKPNELASSSGYLDFLEKTPREAANLLMKLLRLCAK